MSLLYNFVKYTGRIGLPLYFGQLEINGQEYIPKDVPFLIAPNHQSAFLDAVIMGVYNPKPVHFLTRSDVFVKPFIGALEALNMMPVYRIRDGYEKLSKNEEIFARCEALLAKGMPVLIFPEGNMGDGHFLRPLTKGTARLAFQSFENLGTDVQILPVGINYFNHDRPRYKCIVNFGQPLNIRDYMALYNTHKAKGLIQLKNDLSGAIKKLLLIPNKEGYGASYEALNRKNEKCSFGNLKKALADNTYDKATFFTGGSFISKLLALFNPLAIGVVHYLLKKVVKERQFTSSLKYTLGLLLSVIWWIILYVSVAAFFDAKTAGIAVLVSVTMLFLRSEIKKFTDPIFDITAVNKVE